MADRREREGWKNIGRWIRREGAKERSVRSEKRNGKIPLYIGICIRVGTKFRSALHRARRGRGGGDDGSSGRIDRVWAATNPRFSSLPLSSVRSSSLHLSSTRPAHSTLLLHLSSFRFAFFVPPAPFLSLVLTARSSFLPAPPFHRPVLILFFRLPLSFHLFTIIYSLPRFPSLRDTETYRTRLAALSIFDNDCLHRTSIWIPSVRILRPERDMDGGHTHSLTADAEMESQRWKHACCKIHFHLSYFFTPLPPSRFCLLAHRSPIPSPIVSTEALARTAIISLHPNRCGAECERQVACSKQKKKKKKNCAECNFGINLGRGSGPTTEI